MRTVFYCDQLNDFEIHGWASVDEELARTNPALQDSMIELRAGGTLIGQRRRLVARSDVDSVVGQPGVNKGYSIPVLALVAVGTVMGKHAAQALTMNFAGVEIELAKQSPGLTDLSGYRTLSMTGSGWPFIIADVWFASDYELRLRVDQVQPALGAVPPYKVRFFQPDSFAGTRLLPIGETSVNASGIAFLSPFLRSPYLPLLIVVSSDDGEIVCMDAIPFPSLCRGGAHYAELKALAAGRGYMDDLRVVCDALLRELQIGQEMASGAAISDLHVDLNNASGDERIFSPFVLQWLVLALGLRLKGVAPEGADSQAAGLLDRALLNAGLTGQAGTNSRGQGLTLVIPADALPSLAALVSPRLVVQPDGLSSGSFITAAAAHGGPMWYVALPPLPEWLKALQPAHVATPYPQLSGQTGDGSGQRNSAADCGTALAIRFVEDSFRSEETRMFPVAPDVVSGLIGGNESFPDGCLVSVIVSVRNGALFFCDMLASLSLQTIAPRVEVIIVDNRSVPSERHAIAAAAKELFPERHRIIDYDLPFNHSAQANLGMVAAQAPMLCLIDSDIVLHDPRALETLVRIAADPHVATAGCMLLEGRPGKTESVRFCSAGIFPGGLSFGGRPKVTYIEPDCGSLLGPASYPVAANSFAFAVIRKEIWQTVDGLAAERLPRDCSDIDFCLRAIDAGFTNVCTTAVSAYHFGRATRGSEFDVFAAGRITPVALERILSSSTVLRRIG